MAVTLTDADFEKLGPAAKAQLRAVKPTERPAPKKAAPKPPAGPRLPRSNPQIVQRKIRQQRERQQRERTQARQQRIGQIRTSAVRASRGTSRAAGQIRGNVSIGGVFGAITTAALIGAVVFRADTVSGLLGHGVQMWQKVIALGKAG